MRTLIDVTQAQIEALEDIAKADNLSRAAVIRAAIDDYVKTRRHSESKKAFGLWSNNRMDGLEYQEQVRGEW